MRTFRFFDNTGGMNLQKNALSLDSNEAERIENLHLNANGAWSSDNTGYEVLNPSTPFANGAELKSLTVFETVTGVRKTLAQAGGSLLEVDASTGTSLVVSNTVSTEQSLQYASLLGWLFTCSVDHPPLRWNGQDAAEPLPNWPVTINGQLVGNPSLVSTFSNRLILSGDPTNPSAVYLSELENPENFTPGVGASAAGAIQVSPGDGDSITALKRYFLPGTNEEVLVIFKRHSTYLLLGTNAGEFQIQQVSSEFGAVGPRAVTQVGQDLLLFSSEGITSLTTATVQGNLSIGFLSQAIQPELATLNRQRFEQIIGLHHRFRQEVWWFVPSGSSNENNQAFVYSYGQGGAWSVRTQMTASAAVMDGQSLLTGTYDGFLHQQLRGNTYGGEPIHWCYRSPFYPLGNASQRKRIRQVDLFLNAVSSEGLKLFTRWNLDRKVSETLEPKLSVAANDSGSAFGSAIFGQDSFQELGSSIVSIFPSGSGRLFQLELAGAIPLQPVTIEGWSIMTLEGGTR